MKSGAIQIQTIAIIGAQGAMGRFFQERFQGRGHAPAALDRPSPRQEFCRLAGRADLVLLAVPIKAMETVLASLQNILSPKTVLVDICSVKVRPLELMLKLHSGPVVGLHPLFGPNPDCEQPLRVALVPGRDTAAAKAVKELLESIALCPFETSAAEHDRALALIQGLNFVSTISYLSAVSENKELEKFLTPSFGRRLHSARKMLTQDSELFQALFEANPYSQEAVRTLRSYLNLAAAGELDLLKIKACWWFYEEQQGGGA